MVPTYNFVAKKKKKRKGGGGYYTNPSKIPKKEGGYA